MADVIDIFREASRYLTTSVALITTTGSSGPNVMSAEWTFQVSYRPMRLIVLVGRDEMTHENLSKSKEFGANFLSDDQAALANLAGHYTGREVNKLSSQIFQTYHAEKIQVPMVSGCFLNAECKVVQVLETGDHTMFLGEVVNVKFDEAKAPLLYSQRRYWYRGLQAEKKPMIYVTCTVSHGTVRLDGRLQGAENHPQKVALSLHLASGKPVFEETVETDERGYFELVRQYPIPLVGPLVAEAKWNGQKGTASTP